MMFFTVLAAVLAGEAIAALFRRIGQKRHARLVARQINAAMAENTRKILGDSIFSD